MRTEWKNNTASLGKAILPTAVATLHLLVLLTNEVVGVALYTFWRQSVHIRPELDIEKERKVQQLPLQQNNTSESHFNKTLEHSIT